VLLTRFEQLWPGASRSLDFLVDTLMQLFISTFILYIVAILLVRGGLPKIVGPAVVVGSALAFQATLFLMPGLYTTDIFSYVMYSHIAGVLQVNPYTSQPSWFPEVRIFHWIHPLWANAPSIYGPAWIDMTLPLARAVATASEVDKVLAYKLLVNAGHLVGVALIGYVSHRLRPGSSLEAVTMYAWNPLVLFEFGGNGHNDAMMVSAMLLALALYTTSSRWLGMMTAVIAVLLKMTALFLLPYYAMAWAREQSTWVRFFAVGILATLTIPLVVVAFYWPWWDGPATIGPILLWSQGPMFNNYVPDNLSYYLATQRLLEAGGTLDPQQALEQSREQTRMASRIFFVIWCAWELWRVRGGLGIAGAAARVMLVFLLAVNTWVLPWYFTWPLALAILLGWQSTTTKVLLGFSLSAPTVMYYHHFWHPYMSETTYILYLLPLVLAPVMWTWALMQRGWRKTAGTTATSARDTLVTTGASR
jgi:alpha-1,6-mannosyltransferase